MTRQVTEGSPIAVTARSQVGGVVFGSKLKVNGGAVYSDQELKDKITGDDLVTSGAGDFVFYGEPDKTYSFTFADPLVQPIEDVHVVPTTLRPSGQLGVDAHTVPKDVTEQVSDESLVGAPPYALPEHEGGEEAAVHVGEAAADFPPGEPASGTPDGTTASDPSDAPGPDNATPGPGEKDPGPQKAKPIEPAKTTTAKKTTAKKTTARKSTAKKNA